ncbi:signal peptidase II [Micrococcoides hystricis]|uniref:Lipoprotein signal peptidase n=1 Tax=Micrococcoides hystricis TaxID=1572761 RepID=A0ABV6P6T5_9MICC
MTASVPASTAPTSPRRFILPAILGLLGYILDQVTKFWVLSNMHEGETIPVLPPVLSWHFVRNPGAAFSMGTEYTWVFTIIMVVVAAYVIYKFRTTTSKIWLIVMGTLLGGILGNLTDRLFQEPGFGLGHVIDFIAVPNFAVFNVADSLIVCSMIVICILLIKGVPLNDEVDDDLDQVQAPEDQPEPSAVTDADEPTSKNHE